MTITFDDITHEISPHQNLPENYHGFSWDQNIYLISASTYDGYMGSNAMVTSGQYAIFFDDFETERTISSPTRFNFLSAEMTSYGAPSGQYQIKGFAGGVEKYNITVDVNSHSPSLINFNFTNIDRVTFTKETGAWLVMDDLVVGAVIPGPSGVVKGTNGNDKWNGTSGNDNYDGLLGNDTISGSIGNDTLNGNYGNDYLDGGVGNDKLFGGNGIDLLKGGSGHDVLNGGNDNDHINGESGNDTLEGGFGRDTLNGGDGNDTYMIDNFRDVIEEGFGMLAGIDTVRSTVNYTLLPNVENLTLLGFESLNGTGNDIQNIITGNSGDNLLVGMNGNDTLLGGGGDDTLLGGGGLDNLVGGDGSDTYQVGSTEDILIETARDGDQDVVESSVSYMLGDNVEVLVLTGTALEGRGNMLDNLIDGNDVGNSLSGDSGSDSIRGLGGDDTLDGGMGNDTLDGGEGNDIVVYIRREDDYKIHFDPESHTWSVENINYTEGSNEGIDIISDVEILEFSDQDYPLNEAPINLIGATLSEMGSVISATVS